MVKMQMVKVTKMEKGKLAKSHIWCIKESRKGEAKGRKFGRAPGHAARVGGGLGAGKPA